MLKEMCLVQIHTDSVACPCSTDAASTREAQSVTYLLYLGTVKVPATDLVIAREHVHWHHTDGQGHCADNHLPRMRCHQETVHTEQMGQHDATGLTNKTNAMWVSSFIPLAVDDLSFLFFSTWSHLLKQRLHCQHGAWCCCDVTF